MKNNVLQKEIFGVFYKDGTKWTGPYTTYAVLNKNSMKQVCKIVGEALHKKTKVMKSNLNWKECK